MQITSAELQSLILTELSSKLGLNSFKINFETAKDLYYIPDWEETVKEIIVKFESERIPFNEIYYNCVNASVELNALISKQSYQKSYDDNLPGEIPPIACGLISGQLGAIGHMQNIIVLREGEKIVIALIEPQVITADRREGYCELDDCELKYVFKVEFW